MPTNNKLHLIFLLAATFILIFSSGSLIRGRNEESVDQDIVIGANFSPLPLPTREIVENENATVAKIAYGNTVTIQQYPHQISLIQGKLDLLVFSEISSFSQNFDQSFRYAICGGTIIGTQWVITAAHCTDSLAANQYAILAGVNNPFERVGQRIQVVEKYVHPGWSRSTLMNDITLLKLATPLTFNAAVQPAGLRATEYVVGQDTVKVSGWGEMENAQYPTSLRAVEMPVVQAMLCYVWGSINPQTMICAGSGDGKDACSGDSGGPLGQFVNGKFVVGGVVSWGPPICGRAGNRGVYTKVSAFLPWIQQVSGISP